MPPPDDSLFSPNFKLLIPIALSLLILLGLIAAVLIIRKKSKSILKACDEVKITFDSHETESSSPGRILAPSQSETPSIANIMSKGNSEPNYPGVRVQNNNLSFSSVDSNKYKAEGNGKKKSLTSRLDGKLAYRFAEYIEDLCPYATFQLNKQTYSESSYSGNVYSGPYHSVRGSFVYHDNKNDSYRVSCSLECAAQREINVRLLFAEQRATIHKSAPLGIASARLRLARRSIS